MPIGGTAFLGMNQHPRITTNYLNQASRRGDPAPGVPVSTAQVSGSIVQPYDGFIGGKLTITNPWAAQFADPEVGPLYGGVYQYVQFDAAAATPPTRGAFCFWLDEMNYIVTPVYNATNSFKLAGVILNEDDPGNWDFIQIAGIASVLFNAALALGAPAQAAAAAAPTPSGAVAATTPASLAAGLVVMAPGVASFVSPLQLKLGAAWNI